MSAASYNEILARVRSLSAEERARLLKDLSGMAEKKGDGKRARSILEIQGLGKELWAGMDAQEYVDRERYSWNG